MHITIVGASDTYALGFASWAVAAGHQVTIVGPSRGQAEAFAKKINAARATGPHDPIVDNVIFLAIPYNCVLDARDFYGSQLDRKIVVDLTTPINPGTFERIHTEAGSVAQEITRARPGARVVKAFNPRFIGTLGAEQGSTQHTRDLAGDDV